MFRFKVTKWKEIQVGDVIRLRKNDFIPVSEQAHISFLFSQIWLGARSGLGSLCHWCVCFSNRLTSYCCPALNRTASAMSKRPNWMGKWVSGGPVLKLPLEGLSATLKAVPGMEALRAGPASATSSLASSVPNRPASLSDSIYKVVLSHLPFPTFQGRWKGQMRAQPFVNRWAGFRHLWMTINAIYFRKKEQIVKVFASFEFSLCWSWLLCFHLKESKGLFFSTFYWGPTRLH